MFKDRSQVTGFILLALLLIGYLAYNNYSQREYRKQQEAQQRTDSIAAAKAPKAKPAPVVASTDTTGASPLDTTQQRVLPPYLSGTPQDVVLENESIALTFSTKGAFPTAARLKRYRTYTKAPLDFFAGAGNALAFTLPFDNGRATSDLIFQPTPTTGPDGSKALAFTSDLGGGKSVSLIYTLPQEGYMMNVSVRTTGLNAPSLPLVWQTRALTTEKDVADERINSQIYYRYKNKENDYFTVREDKAETLDPNLHWLGLRTHFFSTALIADDGFSTASLTASVKNPDPKTVVTQKSAFTLPLKGDGSAAMRWYIGPNHYQTLKSFKIGLDDMVPLGYGVMAFVKYINKALIIPIFNFLGGFIGNYGVIIMLMTLIIRLLLSFFTYKSYLSSAKMRVLKPELDELRAKYGEDQQRMGMEQMKLYRTAGVNPLGGCLPTLFQLPILFAMYYFFPSSIELRQEPFLWADDLSTYDSIVNLPFNIPFYGDHVSLFTILMTASSLFLALYNRNMTPQAADNPVLKWMPFVFPIMLMGVFNKMAAALTFYYFFSNMISILQQFIIQKFVINEKKIHAQIQENRNKPATPSKWAAKLEEMQRMQQERGKVQPIRKK